ncbi:hypothetical protein [Anabaena catenula]|uniref:CpcD n=1 Tax=Anabaena catenula FACHB-362 TaxID=2692877 RepID=A0ABR8J0M8_9NOST|nr:hypothetical protein [Anabaena catenula]MBD2690994.1 hypothetical protein [Anabaena catenula FACHB-362]
MEYSHLLNDGELLIRVSQFEVHRQDYRIKIDCVEVLEGEGKARFMAAPYLVFPGNAKEEFYGLGETEKAALCDCLGKIKDQPYNLICGIDEKPTE